MGLSKYRVVSLMFRLLNVGSTVFFGSPHLVSRCNYYPIFNNATARYVVSVVHCEFCNSCYIVQLKFLFLFFNVH